MTSRDQSTGGTCTWALRLSSGGYVTNPEVRDATSFHLDWAYVWLSQERAIEVAQRTPWIGASATPVRARP